MDYAVAILVVVALVVLIYSSYMLGKGSADGYTSTLKRENELLNAKLHQLTDRDSKGRFVGNKK